MNGEDAGRMGLIENSRTQGALTWWFLNTPCSKPSSEMVNRLVFSSTQKTDP